MTLARIEGEKTLSGHGFLLGDSIYTSPEQAWGRSVDARTDLYSLGILLYQMLSGRPPFSKNSPTATLGAHINEAPPPLFGKVPAFEDIQQFNLPPQPKASSAYRLAEIAMKCIAKEPEHRFGSASDLVNALREIARQPSS